MSLLIADTFTSSLAKLTGDEQKAVKQTAFDLHVDPVNPGMAFHKLDKAKDKSFWSVRVSNDIRMIVHKSPGRLLLCYVDHHDKAYAWAERRKLETHPRTGAAQLIEIRETVREIVVPTLVAANPDSGSDRAAPVDKALFTDLSDDVLLDAGVPVDRLAEVRAATEDSILTLVEQLPAEAAEALLVLATGGQPRIAIIRASASAAAPAPATPAPSPPPSNPFEHPDAQRRFRVIANVEELQRALDFPWDRWSIFLHPAQRQLVEADYQGPARVSGSAGTGKTIVALHRAVHLARQHPDARVLLTTFSEPLANALRTRLRRLVSNTPRVAERIDVDSLDAVCLRLYKALLGPVALATPEVARELLKVAAAGVPGHGFAPRFLAAEWEQIVDAWQISSWEDYRDVARLGRRTRVPESRRIVLWSIFEQIQSALKKRKLVTAAGMFTRLAEVLAKRDSVPYDFTVIDEAQDVSVAQLRFLAALGGKRPNSLLFAGDLGQRIFQQPFSWKALGVDVRGRSRTLKVNYRTSHQIRSQADRLLGKELVDVDGVVEERGKTVSAFNGLAPSIQVLNGKDEEIDIVSRWLREQSEAGVLPHEMGLFVRSDAELGRARAAASRSGLMSALLDAHAEPPSGHLAIGTMHLAKGLEFRAVAVMACDGDVIPLQARIESVGDDGDLQEVFDSERQLLYVACTRARDALLVTAVDPASEFLDDLGR